MPESSSITDGTQFGIVVGTSVARLITEQLGVRLNFPDKAGELQELSVMVVSLPSIEVAEPELARVVLAEQTAVRYRAQESRLGEHETMLARGKVLAPNPASEQKQTYTWRDIAPDATADFAARLDEIRSALTPKPGDTPGEDPTISELTEVEVAGLLHALISPLVSDLKNIIPLPRRHTGIKKLGKLAAKAVKHPFGRPYDEFLRPDELTKSLREPILASRTARELNQIVQGLANDPHRFLAKLLIAEQRGSIEQAAVEQLDDQIVGLQVPLAAAPKLGKRALGRPHRPQLGEQKKAAPELVATASTPHPKTVEATVEEAKEIVESLGTFTLSMPWMPDGKTTAEVQQLTLAGQTVYVTRGLTPRLEAIAIESRQKAPVFAEGLNYYDAKATHMARLIASGIKPYQKGSGLKRLTPSLVAPPYKTIPIWNPLDYGPNVPRLYFTVIKAAALTGKQEGGDTELNAENDCIVILAETDKANQEDVMNTLTSGSKRYQRQRAHKGR